MERKPKYRMRNDYILAKGLVNGVHQENKNYSNYFNERECDMVGFLRSNWKIKKDKWEHQSKNR